MKSLNELQTNFNEKFNELFQIEIDRLIERVKELNQIVNGFFSKDTHNIFITNLTQQTPDRFYCLIIEREGHLLFAEKKDAETKQVYKLDLNTLSLYQNNEAIHLSGLNHLIRKIRSALKDVSNQKARIYEK